MKSSVVLPCAVLAAAFAISGQQAGSPVDTRVGKEEAKLAVPTNALTSPGSADYVLGPGDQISIIVTDLADDFADKTFRIDMSGELSVPYAGRISAAGLTTEGLQRAISASLTKIIKKPDVTVNVAEFHSQPVSVLGEVNTAGEYQVQGQKKLLEAISMAGGFTEDVGNTVTITREIKWGRVPLPTAHDDPTGQFSLATVSVKNILHSNSPEQNIQVMPADVISVSRAEIVYAVGSVNKPGGYPMGQDETLSALQVVSLAEGLTSTAASQSAKIIRLDPATKNRSEVAVNLKQLLEGRSSDIPLQPGDILFIPNSKAKTAAYKTLQSIVSAATGMAVYGRY